MHKVAAPLFAKQWKYGVFPIPMLGNYFAPLVNFKEISKAAVVTWNHVVIDASLFCVALL